MGEIGIERKEYLYDLSFCDLLLIERGYVRRYRHMWCSTRWSTYQIMSATCGSKNLHECGIFKPTDLIQFPWEAESACNLSEEDIEDLQALAQQKLIDIS